jgi:hypothetical protein
MRNPSLTAGLACFVAAYGLASTPVARAVTHQSSVVMPGASCQLSIPTTNTGVRPKAIGFRNESTTVSNFVICPFATSHGDDNDEFTLLALAVYSLDGAPHMVTCTAVAGMYDYPDASPLYSTKSETVDATDTPIGQIYSWTAADFGGTAGDPIHGSITSSITCSLPPQTAISLGQALYNFDVGS